jgi:transposase
MSEPQRPREVRRRLAIIHHAEEVTGNVATCRYYGIGRQVYYWWLRRYQEQGIDGLRDLSRRPHHSPNATHVDVERSQTRSPRVSARQGCFVDLDRAD